jgi:chemotaxis protein methyltransferase CheR
MNDAHLIIPPQKFRIGYGDYLRFRDLILAYSGLYFPEKKRADLELGLGKALSESPLITDEDGYNLDHYYNLLSDRTNPVGKTELDRLVNFLTVGETHFFRDEAQFDALYQRVLPELIAHKRNAARAIGPNTQPQLRLWSAGCASGEEAYSIAMLLKELIPDIDNWHILILATDINQDSLARAREAIYSEWSFRENRARLLRSRYFVVEPAPNGNGLGKNRYRLDQPIRRMVTFASLNLIEDDYPAIFNNTAGMDLILCRNVTIYFTQEATQQVINRFYKSLVQGGWLVVGHAEPTLWIYRDFQSCTFPGTLLYQKTGRPHPWPADWEQFKPTEGFEKIGDLVSSSRPAAGLDASSLANGLNQLSEPSRGESFKVPTWPEKTGPVASATQKPLAPANGTLNSKTSAPVGSPQLPPAVVCQEAERLLQLGQIEQVIQQLQTLVTSQPGFAPTYTLLGRAYANLGQWEQAKQWCESGLKLDTLSAETYSVLALIYQQEEQIEKAICTLKKAIYLEREAPLHFFNLAILHKKAHQLDDARRTFHNVIKILEKWSPDKIIPDSGGMTAKRLLDATRQLLQELGED